MTIRVKAWTYDFKRKPNNNHYPAGTSFGYDLNYKWLEITLQDLVFTSYSRYTTFVKYINDWQDDNGHFTVRMIYYSTPLFAELKGDGKGSTWTMNMKKGLQKGEKVSLGDEQVWIIHTLLLEEAG
jgi:hypothetical protein